MTVARISRPVRAAFTTHFTLCWTGVAAAPAILRNRAAAFRWASRSWRLWLVLAGSALIAWGVLPALAAKLVDVFHPLDAQGFGKAISGFFDGSTTKLKGVRAARLQQFLWGGYAVLALNFVSELLRSFGAAGAPDARDGAGRADAAADAAPTVVLPRNEADAPTMILPRAGADAPTMVLPRSGSDAPTRVMARAPDGEAERHRHIADGRYRLDHVLGTGGAGQVYKAFDTRLQRFVAVKQLVVQDSGEDDFARRFEQEARTLARLSHAHIVAVHDLVVEGGQFWMVMELLTGGDLKRLVRERRSLPPAEALSIARDIASALVPAHAQQIVHRDIKPENVMRSAEGVWKLTDFGIAKQQSSEIKTQMGLVIGSLAYLSPEQAAGAAVDARSDIYSLGVSLYEMLSGALPFKGDMRSVLAQHLSCELPTLEGVPPEINALLQRMTAKSAEARFADCRELIAAIDACRAALGDGSG